MWYPVPARMMTTTTATMIHIAKISVLSRSAIVSLLFCYLGTIGRQPSRPLLTAALHGNIPLNPAEDIDAAALLTKCVCQLRRNFVAAVCSVTRPSHFDSIILICNSLLLARP